MITGCIYLDLTFDPMAVAPGELHDAHDRRVLQRLSSCPDGVRVIVDIGRRKWVTHDAAVWLHEHDHRLQIEIRGEDPDAVRQFIRAGRAGRWDAIA